MGNAIETKMVEQRQPRHGRKVVDVRFVNGVQVLATAALSLSEARQKARMELHPAGVLIHDPKFGPTLVPFANCTQIVLAPEE